MTPDRADVGVVGAGAVGLATAYALGERGVSVRVYEAGEPGAAQSGGDSRIFRHAHDDPRLVRLARESRGVYREWSDALGRELVRGDGALALGPSALDRAEILRREGAAVRVLDPAEVPAVLPVLGRVEQPAVLDEDGGSINARGLVTSLVAVLGDRLVRDEVLAVRAPAGGGVEVRTGGRTDVVGRLVVCAGRQTAALARSVGLTVPVRPGIHARCTFRVRGPAPRRLATLQDSGDAAGSSGAYAAAVPGNGAYAVGSNRWVDAHPDGGPRDPDELAALAEAAVAYVRRQLPGLDPDPVGVRHCWTTELPWSPDGLAVWEHRDVLFVAGNNLFKMAPLLGRRLAAAATGEPLDPLLRPEARLGEPR